MEKFDVIGSDAPCHRHLCTSIVVRSNKCITHYLGPIWKAIYFQLYPPKTSPWEAMENSSCHQSILNKEQQDKRLTKKMSGRIRMILLLSLMINEVWIIKFRNIIFLNRTREQRISDSGNSTTSSGAGYAENSQKNSANGRKRSTASSTTSTLSNQFSNGTIVDDIADDEQNFDDVPSSASTGNAEIRTIKNEIQRSPRKNSGWVGHDLNAYKNDFKYQDAPYENIQRMSNTVSTF